VFLSFPFLAFFYSPRVRFTNSLCQQKPSFWH